jgi:uncharacterized protein
VQPTVHHVPAGVPRRTRLVGIDVARALAFVGMLLAHFATATSSEDPTWLVALDGAADGRAAPLFCVLLGLGAGLLVTGGAPDRALVRRGIALFVLGVVLWPLVEQIYLILPEYGVLLAALPVLRRIHTRLLLPAAALAFLVPSLVTATLGASGLRGTGQPTSYDDLREVGEIVRYLLWTGGYPVVGWVGFVLVGLWLSRQRLADVALQWRLLLVGVGVAVTQPLVDATFVGLGGDPLGAAPPEGPAAFFAAAAHSNQTAWYVLASATAVAAIGACLLVTRRPSPVVVPVAHLGQLALTAYLAHILLGQAVLWDWMARQMLSLGEQLLVVGAVVVAFTAAATVWRRAFARGPLEALVRMASG